LGDRILSRFLPDRRTATSNIVNRKPRELAENLIFRIWDGKSHTVLAEEVDHHQVDLGIIEGGDPEMESQRAIPVATKLRR
jgi:hypothetical protein